MPEISIVILTFNSERFIKSCLDCVFTQDYQNFEVVVVDNNSQDRTVNFIKENYPQVILIENKKNLGACRARNQAIKIANGKWLLSLDCDVILEKSFLNKIIIKLAEETNETVGMFQPKILNMDRKTIYSCGIYLSKLRRFYDIGKGQLDNGQFNTSQYIFGVCSAAAVYNRGMLEEIKEDTGYFDERFFFLVEDVDLAWRAQRKGWKALYYPEARCYHYGNSSNLDKKFRQYLCFRNRYFLIFKNDSINVIRNIVPFLLYDLPRLLFLILTNNYTLQALKKINRIIKYNRYVTQSSI